MALQTSERTEHREDLEHTIPAPLHKTECNSPKQFESWLLEKNPENEFGL